jgi:hypothetical protein
VTTAHPSTIASAIGRKTGISAATTGP